MNLLQVASELQLKIQPECVKMSRESSKGLKELAKAIKNMRFPSAAVEVHLQNSKAAADEVKNIMGNYPTKPHLQEMVSILVVASVLIDITKFVEKISVSVNDLSQKAGFKKPDEAAAVKPVDDGDAQVVVDIVEINNNPLHPTQPYK